MSHKYTAKQKADAIDAIERLNKGFRSRPGLWQAYHDKKLHKITIMQNGYEELLDDGRLRYNNLHIVPPF